MGLFDFIGDLFEKVLGWFIDLPEEPEGGIEARTSPNVAPLPIIYGTRKITGVRVFSATGGDKNRYLWYAIALCEGEIDDIVQVYIDGQPISAYTPHQFGSGQVLMDTTPLADALVEVRFWRGADDQPADPMLMEAPGWTANHRLRGVAYLACRFAFSEEVFSGLPRVEAVVRGRKVVNLNDLPAGRVYSDNPALLLYDYLRDARAGKGLPVTALDRGAFRKAATYLYTHKLTGSRQQLGSPTRVEAGGRRLVWVGNAPANLSMNVDATLYNSADAATSTKAARLITVETLTETAHLDDAGEGGDDGDFQRGYRLGRSREEYEHRLIVEPIAINGALSAPFNARDTIWISPDTRYRSNLVLRTDQPLIDNVRRLLATCRGLLPWSAGQYSLIIEGAPTDPVLHVNDNLLVEGVSVSAPPRRETYNTVRATFTNPNKNWEEDTAIWPPGNSNLARRLRTLDGGEKLQLDLSLPACTHRGQALALARIALYRSRNALRAQFRAMPEAIILTPGDIIELSDDTLGWNRKTMLVTGVSLDAGGDVLVESTEYDQTIYDDEDIDLDALLDDTEHLNPLIVPVPEDVAITNVFVWQEGGAAPIHGIHVKWNPITGAARIEVAYRAAEVTDEAGWAIANATGDARSVFIGPLRIGAEYSVRLRVVNRAGILGRWTDIFTHTVDADTTPPDPPSNIFLVAGYRQIGVRWQNPSDPGFSHVGGRLEQLDDAGDIVSTVTGESYGTMATLPGLLDDTRYRLALWSIDDAGNRSEETRAHAVRTLESPTQQGVTGGIYDPETGQVTLTLEDGTQIVTGDLRGEDGDPGDDGPRGIGITSGAYDKDTGVITIVFSDGDQVVTGDLRGPKGDPGVSVDSVHFDAQTNSLRIQLSDDSPDLVIPNLRGIDGADAAEVESITYDENADGGTLCITLDDGTQFKFGNVRGEKGLPGDPGADGLSATAGAPVVFTTTDDGATFSPAGEQSVEVSYYDGGELCARGNVVFSVNGGALTHRIQAIMGQASHYRATTSVTADNRTVTVEHIETQLRITANAVIIRVPAGKPGTGLTGGNYDEDTGKVTLTLDDDTEIVTNDLRGKDGNGIERIQRNAQTGVVTIIYADDTRDEFTIKDGESVTANVTMNAEGDITVTFSDGTSFGIQKGRDIKNIERKGNKVKVHYSDGGCSEFDLRDGVDGVSGTGDGPAIWTQNAPGSALTPPALTLESCCAFYQGRQLLASGCVVFHVDQANSRISRHEIRVIHSPPGMSVNQLFRTTPSGTGTRAMHVAVRHIETGVTVNLRAQLHLLGSTPDTPTTPPPTTPPPAEPTATMRLQTIYRRAAGMPATPVSPPDQIPDNWSENAPQPTQTLAVWIVSRTLTLNADGTPISATPWGNVNQHLPSTSTTPPPPPPREPVITTRIQRIYILSADKPRQPGSTGPEMAPAGWTFRRPDDSTTEQAIYTSQRTQTLTDDVVTDRGVWSDPRIDKAKIVVTVRTQIVYRLATTRPAAPPNPPPSNPEALPGPPWSQAAPQPTTTQAVWRARRNQTLRDGRLFTQTGWFTPEEHLPATGGTTAPLRVSLGGPHYVSPPGAYTLRAAVTGGTPPYRYSWSLSGRSPIPGGATLRASFTEGTHHVSITITDATGTRATDSTTVEAYTDDEGSNE